MKRKQFVATALLCAFISVTLQASTSTDLNQFSWYYQDVINLQRAGVLRYSDHIFHPTSLVSYGEAIKMILTVTGKNTETAASGDHRITEYFFTEKKQKIINSTKIELLKPITRIEVAEYLYKALHDTPTDIKTTQHPFYDTKSPYADALFTLKIFQGTEEGGHRYFRPNQQITHAEMSAILSRTYDYLFGQDSSLPNEVLMKQVLRLEEYSYVPEPLTQLDFEKYLLAMASDNRFSATIQYTSYGFEDLLYKKDLQKMIKDAFYNVSIKYPEYLSFTDQIEMNFKGTNLQTTLVLTLKNRLIDNDTIKNMRLTFFQRASDIYRNLQKNNKIKNTMSEKEKAKILYRWIALNTVYDNTFKAVSFTGYGAMEKHRAVCQGYTSAYNYLCKLAGIHIIGITGTANGTEHMWSKAMLDGVPSYIDVTFGDPQPDQKGYCDDTYFAKSADFMRKNHTWEE